MAAPLGKLEFARRDEQGVECRNEPVRVSWNFADLASADAHSLSCRFSCSVRIADSPSDRRMFAEVFLTSQPTVTTQTLAEHFARVLRSTANAFASQSKAADVVGGGGAEEQKWIGALTQAARPVAFAAGLELLAPFQLEIDSPTFQQQRLDEISRARAEERAAGQVLHLQRASELLRQFQEMRRSAPDLSAGKLLEQISPSERGLMFQTLLLGTSKQNAATPLWAVSGGSLVRIDPNTTPPRTTLIPLPSNAGPLRSVQFATIAGQPSLLIGARTGVLIVRPESLPEGQIYSMPELDSQLGFNSVVATDEEIWASHGSAGIVVWKLDNLDRPVNVYAETATDSAGPGTRNLLSLDPLTFLYSLGGDLVMRDHASRQTIATPSTSPIISLIPTQRWIIIVHEDGTIAILDRASRTVTDHRRRSARLSAAAAMPWLGDMRLLLATDEGPIDCIGLDDSLVTEYLSPYRGLKILSATASLIAAVSPDRQRIIIWNSSDAQRPAGEIHITSMTRHRVADIEFDAQS